MMYMIEKKHTDKSPEDNWHSLEIETILEQLETSPEGLSGEDASERLSTHGPNTLPAKEPPTIWAVLLNQILNPLIFILLAAAVASLAIGELSDAIFILAVIVLNSALGAYQEFNAEKSAAALQRIMKLWARVRRDNKEAEIESKEVVPGDIVLLESGRKVPADLRLLQAHGLAADESFLTGESMAAEKHTDRLPQDTVVSDRNNMVFAGSTITSGRGSGVVVGTGTQTQVGIIAEKVSHSEGGKPPLVLRMEKFVKQISILILVISAGLSLLLGLQGESATAIFFFVVAMAVSAIPEGMPVAMTVALSIATKRMSERNVIVRRLTAVESLGSCTVIASDKTGTLTVNQQTARMIILPDGQTFTASGEGYNGEGEVSGGDSTRLTEPARERLERLAQIAVLANEASLVREDEEWRHRGDAMDVAFLAFAFKLGLNPAEVRDQFKVVDEIPYESEQKFSATFYEDRDTRYVAAKGAVERILDFCTQMHQDGDLADLDREVVERQETEMAEKGLRVLAVAGGELSATDVDEDSTGSALSGLVLHGLVGFIDPLRAEAREAVENCRRAGIKVMMITGDHPSTAGAIAEELSLSDGNEPVVTGHDLSKAGSSDSPEFEEKVMSTHVFARVAPAQKLEIVGVLIRNGEFVAVTGDGVNDAPALRRANIGVAMGSGTDVAKEVGSMIVTDDNFASIVAGVEEGRFAYDNVRKVIYLLISTGAAEVLMFMAAIITGLKIPLVAVQLLWLNLVTNGIQDVALAFEGGEPGAMKRKPRRPDEKIFDSQMVSQTAVSGMVIGSLAFGFWYWLMEIEKVESLASARNSVLLLMVLLQNVHVFNCRSESVSAFRVPINRNYILLFGVVIAQGIHILSMRLPFMQSILGVETVTLSQWFIALGLALTVLFAMEIFKWLARRGHLPIEPR